MKEFVVNVKGLEIKVFQKDDGKFIIPNFVKELEKQGTCLKPAYEPIVVARKPFDGSLVDNIIEYGVGGLNIDECRVGNDYICGGTAPDLRDVGRKQKEISGIDKLSFGQVSNAKRIEYEGHYGRFPSNVIIDGSEEVTSGFPVRETQNGSITKRYKMNNQVYGEYGYCNTWDAYQDSGSAMRYYYCAKASKKDRDEGLTYHRDVTYELRDDAPKEIVEEIKRLLNQ